MSEYDLWGRVLALRADPASCALHSKPHEKLDKESIRKHRDSRENQGIWRIVARALGNHVTKWSPPDYKTSASRPERAPPSSIKTKKISDSELKARLTAHWEVSVLSGFSLYDEIAALDPLDLDKLYASVILLEQQLFISNHNLAADLDLQVKMPLWTDDEFLALSVGFCPENFDKVRNNRRAEWNVTWPAFDSYFKNRKLAERALKAGDIRRQMRPQCYLKWAKDIGLQLNAGLLAEMKKQGKWPVATAPEDSPQANGINTEQLPTKLQVAIHVYDQCWHDLPENMMYPKKADIDGVIKNKLKTASGRNVDEIRSLSKPDDLSPGMARKTRTEEWRIKKDRK